MVLAFRSRDYRLIKETAIHEGMTIKSIIVAAANLIGMDPNFYANPVNIEAYQKVELVDIEITLEEFKRIIGKANFHNYIVEAFIVQAVKIYRILNLEEDGQENDE